jgi:hypothetical protein
MLKFFKLVAVKHLIWALSSPYQTLKGVIWYSIPNLFSNCQIYAIFEDNLVRYLPKSRKNQHF